MSRIDYKIIVTYINHKPYNINDMRKYTIGTSMFSNHSSINLIFKNFIY